MPGERVVIPTQVKQRLLDLSRGAAEDFQSGNDSNGYQKMAEIAGILQVNATGGAAGIEVPPEQAARMELNVILLRLLEGLEQRDGALLADILEYEFIPALERVGIAAEGTKA